MRDQLIVLVDEEGNPIGTAPKLATHHAHTPRHLAFSVYIFNDKGDFLVTQRAHEKKVWGGVWTNSCCGHPTPEESFTDAIKRRTQFELGMQVRDIEQIAADYKYTTPLHNGVIENEYCPIFIAKAASPIQANPSEVAAYKWTDWGMFVKQATQDINDTWSWWCKDQLSYTTKSKKLLTYARK